MAPRRATPRSLRSLPERRTSPGARPVPYSTVRSRRSEQYRPPRAGRPSAARVCDANKRKFTAKSVSSHSPRFDAFSRPRVARTDRRGTTRWPSPDSLYLVASIPDDEFRRVLFGLQNSVFWTRLFFFFPNSPRGWAGRWLRNQPGIRCGTPMCGGTRLAEKKPQANSLGLRGELPNRRER